MKPFSILFGDNDTTEYEGKRVHKYYKLSDPGEYVITLSNMKEHSKLNQAIALFFLDFEGEYYLLDTKRKISKTRFPKETFWIATAPSEIRIRIRLKTGNVFICNGSDPIGTREFCYTMYMGCAMYIENLEHNKYRLHCNDHEIDDDFDDLVFEMEVIKNDL